MNVNTRDISKIHVIYRNALIPAELRLTNWKGNLSAVTSIGLVSAKLTISM